MRLVTHHSTAVPPCELAESEIPIRAEDCHWCVFKMTELEEEWNEQGLTLKTGQCRLVSHMYHFYLILV